MQFDISPLRTSFSAANGPFGLKLKEDAGVVLSAELQFGYGHRGIEKNMASLTYYHALVFSDRTDFLAAPAYNLAFAKAAEALGGIEVPPRGQAIREILLHLSRISSHLANIGAAAELLRFPTVRHYCLRERERFADLFELFCGSRLAFGSIKIGGVADDVSDGFLHKMEFALTAVLRAMEELRTGFFSHPVLDTRLRGMGRVPLESLQKFAVTGPNLRASQGGVGDCYARYQRRLQEIEESVSECRRLASSLDRGNCSVPVGVDFSPRPGDVLVNVPGPRGTIFLYLASNGSNRPVSVKFGPPSLNSLRCLQESIVQEQCEDVLQIINSFDISISEVDR